MADLPGDLITVQNLSYSYSNQEQSGSRHKALSGLSFSIKEASYVAIVGSNGSGKSTLCRLICGLLDLQENSGSIKIAPHKRLGLVFQSPKDQIVSSKVYRDTAFGPQNLRLSAGEVELRTIEYLSLVELLDKAESPSNSLSLGQTQKLAMAGMLAVIPDILILDEALSMLDPDSRKNLYEFLREWHRKGNTIIHITHDLEAIKEAQVVIGLENGELFYNGSSKDFLAGSENLIRITGETLGKNKRIFDKEKFKSENISFSFDKLCFSYGEQESFIKNLSFDLYKGSLTALTGASGAGKSTLLELGAGLLKASSGKVLCNEYPALAQQNCSAALFEAFAADDVAFGPRNNGIKGKALVELVRNSMEKAGLPFDEYAERQSACLSGGEQRRLAIAGILAMGRDVIFFDEPTASLDGKARIKVMNMLRQLADEGKTVLFTSHHPDEAAFADREIKIENGKIIADSQFPEQTAAVPEPTAVVPEPVEGQILNPLTPYKSAAMLDALKKAGASLSGSGWKTKCPLEKLPSFVRILLFLLLFVLSLLFRSLLPCLIMLAVSVIYCLSANFKFGRMLATALKILPFLCFFAVFQLIFRNPLPDEVLFTSWKYLTISPSKLIFCLNSILRTYAALFCVSAFFVSTPEADLIDGLKKIIPSPNLILVLEVIFRFIPLLVDEAAVIIKTQIIRGGLGKVKGGLAKIKAVIPLIVPLVIRTVKRSEILAEAIVMRCFNEK